MRRMAAVTGAALCALFVTAGGASANGPRDSVSGSAKNTFFPSGGENHLSVAAHGFQADVTGHVRGSGDFNGEFRVAGHVTCLRVEDNRASIKYRFDQSEGSTAMFKGGGVQVFIEDNGNPGDPGPPDRNGNDAPEPPGLFDLLGNDRVCDSPTARQDALNPIDSGNYVVRDAP